MIFNVLYMFLDELNYDILTGFLASERLKKTLRRICAEIRRRAIVLISFQKYGFSSHGI